MIFRNGYLRVESMRDIRFPSVLTGHYDLGLFTASWDRRCLSILQAEAIDINHSVVLCFAKHDEFGFQKNNEGVLCDHLRSIGSVVHRIEDVSEDVEREWQKLWRTITQFVATAKPRRCLVDLSTCPRYYSLGLIAGLISTSMSSEISVLYTEGEYDKAAYQEDLTDVPFSLGRWSNLPIPFLHGEINPSRRRHYIVSVGFEGIKTARVLSRDDPERITIIYPIPGVLPEYDEEVRRRNADIVERFKIPSDQILSVAAGEAVAVWRELARASQSWERDEDLYFLCCGTKAHSLGMALHTLLARTPTVLYNVPDRHSFVDVEPSGHFAVFSICDLSAPTRQDTDGQ
jgi:hypothetical protein